MLDTQVDKLDYDTVEEIIANYFELGDPQHSSLPIKFSDNESGSFSVIGLKASGEFHIRTTKLSNGKFQLCVSLIGKLHKT